MEWLPAASEDVVNAARQLLSSETLPSTFVPSVKVTVPVGVPGESSQSTYAMKVTGSPNLLKLLVEPRRVKVKAAVPAMVDTGDTSAPVHSTNKTATATRTRRRRKLGGCVSAGRL
jgi:hypothetical protein